MTRRNFLRCFRLWRSTWRPKWWHRLIAASQRPSEMGEEKNLPWRVKTTDMNSSSNRSNKKTYKAGSGHPKVALRAKELRERFDRPDLSAMADFFRALQQESAVGNPQESLRRHIPGVKAEERKLKGSKKDWLKMRKGVQRRGCLGMDDLARLAESTGPCGWEAKACLDYTILATDSPANIKANPYFSSHIRRWGGIPGKGTCKEVILYRIDEAFRIIDEEIDETRQLLKEMKAELAALKPQRG